MRISPYREDNRDILRKITATAFGRNTSIDYTIERGLGRVTDKNWARHKKRANGGVKVSWRKDFSEKTAKKSSRERI